MSISTEMMQLIEAKTAELKKEFEKHGSLEERFNFLLLVVVSQAVVTDGAMAAIRMCLPKQDVERAESAIAKAQRESNAAGR